jgi:anthranilate phosphoribosyltransferase
VEDLKGGDRDRNAQEMRDVLSAGDHTNAKRDSVVLNAGMGLYVSELVDSIEEGIKAAREALNSGKATEKLNLWIEVTKGL